MYYAAKIFVIVIIVIVIIAVVIAVLRYFIPVPADAEVLAVFAVYRNYFGLAVSSAATALRRRISSVGVPVKIMLLVTVSVLILLLVPISGASAVLSSSALA